MARAQPLTAAPLALPAAGAAAYILARRLSSDSFAALPAAAAFALSPALAQAVRADPRLAVCAPLLPVLLLLFYRLTEAPVDAEPWRRRSLLGLLTLLLVSLVWLDARFATVAGLSVWIVLLTGFFMHRGRREGDWTEPFQYWSLCSALGFLSYVPLWWMKRNAGTVPPLPPVSMAGADLLRLLSPSAVYAGLAPLALAAFAGLRSRSYRPQAALWMVLASLCFWLSLGSRFHWGGAYIWWVPALYRGVRRIGWLGAVPPLFFQLAAQLALAVLAAYAMRALWTMFRPSRLRWVRPLTAAAATALIAADYFR